MKQIFDSFASLVKTLLWSRRPFAKGEPNGRTLIILGNGPSLRDALDKHADILHSHDLMALNFAANTPDFLSLRPTYYIVADGVFFEQTEQPNVRSLWANLKRIDFDMTLFVPVRYASAAVLKALPSNITVRRYNLTPAEGNKALCRFLFGRGLAMPRPRNVLIPAIMTGLRLGYRNIVLTGADHSWSRTLWVDDENVVQSVQPHFYKDNEAEHKRVESLYKNIRLHSIYESFAIAFRSYHHIADYARHIGANIYNATPGSFIDAFERIGLDSLKPDKK